MPYLRRISSANISARGIVGICRWRAIWTSTLSRETADGYERQGQPLRRQEARHDPQVHQRLRRDQDGDPERQVAAEGIGRPQSDPEPAPDQNDEEGDDGRGADEAQLLADDREDEIRVRFREVEELLAGRADALAEDPPVAEREPGLDDLKAAPARIRPR